MERCPALAIINQTLHSVTTDILQIEQAGICSTHIEKLRNAFNRKVSKVLTVERIEPLRTQIESLRAEMQDITTELYEDTVASVMKLLTINPEFSVRSFRKRQLASSLDELNPDYKLYLSSLQYLNLTNNKPLAGTVFDAILSRLNKLSADMEKRLDTGRNDLVTLLCWTVNNRLLEEKYREQQDEVLKLALQFYPKDGNTKDYKADIESRKTCSERLPDTVIRGISLGLVDFV